MKKLMMSLIAGVLMLMGVVAQPVWADGDGNICDDLDKNSPLYSQAGCDLTSDKTADKVVGGVINVVLSLVGVLAVCVLIVGGIMYITSTGDAAKVHRAKNAIIYGVVGLVVSLLAYAIVNFVVKNIG